MLLIERSKYVFLAGVCCIGVALSYALIAFAHDTNGQYGFPSDKPMIDLRFAESVHHYRSYSFYRNTMVVSGSNSPLHVFALAFGIVFTRKEFLLQYVLGVGFLVAAAIMLYRLGVQQFSSSLLALGAVLLFVVESRVQWSAIGGAETTLFVFLLVTALYHYQKMNWRSLAVFAGLLMWARPEAIVFYCAVAFDMVFRTTWAKERVANAKALLSIFLPIVVAYFAFNLWVSTSMFPRSVGAELAMRAADPIALSRVLQFFFEGNMVIVTFFTAIGVVELLARLRKREVGGNMIAFLFSIGVVLFYWLFMPASELRGLAIIVPCVILLAMSGLQFSVMQGSRTLQLLQRKRVADIVRLAVVGFASLLCTMGSWNMRHEFASACKQMNEEVVRTARWLYQNTPKSAVVATDQIGAIAFYGERKVFDLLGRVSPIVFAESEDAAKLAESFARDGVTHIAMRRNKLQAIDQQPLFTSDELDSEAIQVFEFKPGNTQLNIIP